MTSSPSTAPSSPQYIAQLFKDKNIQKVAIIDDADDPRSETELYADEKGQFWAELDLSNEEAKREFLELIQSTLGREITGPSDINDEVLQLLWSSRGTLGTLRAPVEEILFPRIIEKLAPLDSLERHLVDDLNVLVLRDGTEFDVEEKLKGVSLVFIDYVLGPETDPTTAIERAETISKRIYDAFSANHMPLIILMSSDERAQVEEERFRDKSRLLRGMFYFATKADLRNEDQLYLSLAAWGKTLPASAHIHRFVKTLEDSVYPVFDEFIRGVKALSLDDYAYIQHLSLQEDGQPLGDYLLWLYNSYLGHLLFEGRKAIRDQQKVVDGLSHNYLPPSQSMPSNQLAKMYHSALFNMNVGELGVHPMWAQGADEGFPIEQSSSTRSAEERSSSEGAPKQETGDADNTVDSVESRPDRVETMNSADPNIIETLVPAESPSDEESASSMPYLHLGDVFINDSQNYVLMVINAECDLAFGPSRMCDMDGTVMFVRGELQAPEKWGSGPSLTRTELFEYEGKKYRIVWDIKKIFSYRHGDVVRELAAKGLKRKARLRLPFALDVQRAFAANLTRIGMPVNPPIYHPTRLEVWGYDRDKTPFRLIEPHDDFAFWILTKKDNNYSKQLFLTVEFAHVLKTQLNNYIEKLKAVVTHPSENDAPEVKKQAQRYFKRIESLELFKLNYEHWFLELKPVPLPGNRDLRVLYPDVISIRYGWQPEATYKDQQQIMINIIQTSYDSLSGEFGLSEVALSHTSGVDPEQAI